MTRALGYGISYSEDWQCGKKKYIPLGGLADMKMWIMLGRRSKFPEQVQSYMCHK
jgi:hypothetical protein